MPVKTEKRDEIHNQEDRFKFHGPKNKINGKVKKLIDSYFYWDKHPAKGFSYTEEMPSEPIFIFFLKTYMMFTSVPAVISLKAR